MSNPGVGFTQSKAQKDQRKAESDRKRRELADRVQEVKNAKNEAAQKIAADLDIPLPRVRQLLGEQGNEARKHRKASAWNGFVAKTIDEQNYELEPGEKPWSAATVKARFGDVYNHATDEQKDEWRKYAEELRSSRAPSGVKKTGRAAAADVRSTLMHIESKAKALEERTGHQVMIFAAKGDALSLAAPSFHVSDRAVGFLDNNLKMGPSEVTSLMEAYTVLGQEGVAATADQISLSIKKDVVARIQKGLRAVSGRHKAVMNYENYHNRIVMGLYTVLKGWPTGVRFRNPTNLRRPELKLLLSALKARPPTLYFSKITPEEADELDIAHKVAKETAAAVASGSATTSTSASGPSNTAASPAVSTSTAVLAAAPSTAAVVTPLVPGLSSATPQGLHLNSGVERVPHQENAWGTGGSYVARKCPEEPEHSWSSQKPPQCLLTESERIGVAVGPHKDYGLQQRQ